MYFGSISTPVGTFIQCWFLAEIGQGIGDPVLYYFSEMIKSNGYLKFDRKLYNIFAVQIAGSVIGGVFASWIWSFEVSKMHWMHQMNYFHKPISSLAVGLGRGIFMETSAFLMLYLWDKIVESEKFEKAGLQLSAISLGRLKNVLNSAAITGAVMWCVQETGAPISPSLALGMNLYSWQMRPISHLLVYLVCPGILMHWLALFETRGKERKVGKDKKKLIEKIQKSKQHLKVD